MDSSNRIFGIDLGTTYSCISYVDENGKAVVVAGENNRLVTPSVVYFESEDNAVVGEVAKEYSLVEPMQTVELIKQYMGDPTWQRDVFGKTYRPEDISALILKKMVKFAEAETNIPVTDVVITTPAYFNSAQRTATEQAGQLAGLNVHAIIPEPTAAAIAYSVADATTQTVLVFDLGGGTFDVTVINVSAGDVTVVCTDGDHDLGGRLWDNALVEHLVAEWRTQTGLEQDPTDDAETAQSFVNHAENAKRILSNRETAPITLHHEGGRARVEITRERFDELTSDLLERTVNLTRTVLDLARNLGHGDISKILLVGGSSYMPQVKRRLDQEFGLPMELFDPDQSVAKGAAIYASNKQVQELYEQAIQNLFPRDAEGAADLTEEQKSEVADEVLKNLPAGTTRDSIEKAFDQHIVNVCSKTFGVVATNENGKEMVFYLIKKNAQVPAKKEQRFGTVDDNQISVLVKIIESNGDNLPDTEPLPLPPHAKEIGSVTLDMPSGVPKNSPIMIRYFLSEDGGRLRVEAEELSEGRQVDTEVSERNALTQAELEERRSAIAIQVT